MNENLYMENKKIPHETLYVQCRTCGAGHNTFSTISTTPSDTSMKGISLTIWSQLSHLAQRTPSFGQELVMAVKSHMALMEYEPNTF